jgi:hypothetical protein
MKHYRLTMYKDGKFVGPTAMMLGTNKQSAVALARDMSTKYVSITGPPLTMSTETPSNMVAS